MHDPVENPAHYNMGEIECIDGIRAMMSEPEFIAFCRGTAMAYVWRCTHKGGHEDLAKAVWYLRMGYGDDPRLDRRHSSPPHTKTTGPIEDE